MGFLCESAARGFFVRISGKGGFYARRGICEKGHMRIGEQPERRELGNKAKGANWGTTRKARIGEQPEGQIAGEKGNKPRARSQANWRAAKANRRRIRFYGHI